MGENGPDSIKGLTRQQPLLIESLTPVINALIKGEAQVGIGLINTVTQFKGPVDYAPIEHYLADPSLFSLGAKTARPNAAKLYIDYACLPEGQEAFAKAGEFVLYPGIYPAIHDADKVIARVVFMDNPSEEEFKTIMAEFRGVFFAK